MKISQSDLVNPPEKVSRKAHVGSMEEYFKQYERSIKDPEDFWSEVRGKLLLV